MNITPSNTTGESRLGRLRFWHREHVLHLAGFAVLTIAAAVLMVWLRAWALQDSTLTADENSYEFQANLFARGQLKYPFPGCSRAFFHEMIVMDVQKGWFSRYQPGHSLWLTPGAWFGRPHIMVILSGILALVLTMAAAARIKGPPLATTLMFVLSPFFLFTQATLLSHSTGLLATALIVYAYIRWKQTTGPRAAALAGAAWGGLLLTRPFTAACIAPVFALDAIVWFLRDRPNRGLICLGLVGAAVTAGVGVACLLTYNTVMVGSPFIMTHTFCDAGDAIGFGGVHRHTLARGLENLQTNLFQYDQWLWGWKGSLFTALGLAIYGWDRRWTPWLLGCAVVAATGHILFWFPGIQDTGPIYWFETIPFVFAAAALGVGRIVRRVTDWRLRLAAAVVVVMVLAAASIRFVADKASALRKQTARYAILYDAVMAAPPNAVVMANSSKQNYTALYNGQLIFNPFGLASQPIVVRMDSEADETFLRRQFAGRPLFFLDLRQASLKALPEGCAPMNWSPSLNSIAHDAGTKLRSEKRVSAIQARAKHDSSGWLVRDMRRSLTPGDYVLDVELQTGKPARKAGGKAVRISLRSSALANGQDLAWAYVHALGTTSTSSVPFRVESVSEVEVRVWFTGSSDVSVKSVVIRDRVPPIQPSL